MPHKNLRLRRRALLLAALPSAKACWAAPAPPDADALLLAMAQALGMDRTDLRLLARRIRTLAGAAEHALAWRAGAERLLAAVGNVPHTARATVPSLVQDDFSLGRTLAVQGLVFSQVELALLAALGRPGRRRGR